MNTKTYFEDIGAWPKSSGSKGPRIGLAYGIGFVLALALTIAEYVLAVQHLLSYDVLLITLLVLACIQFIVQVAFFLHLGKDSKDRLLMLSAVSVVVLILVSGSVWIMLSLDNRMMPSAQQMEQYMNDQSGM